MFNGQQNKVLSTFVDNNTALLLMHKFFSLGKNNAFQKESIISEICERIVTLLLFVNEAQCAEIKNASIIMIAYLTADRVGRRPSLLIELHHIVHSTPDE